MTSAHIERRSAGVIGTRQVHDFEPMRLVLLVLGLLAAGCSPTPSAALPTSSLAPSPTGSAVPSATVAASDLSQDEALSVVDRYEHALATFDAQAAWTLLSPRFRSVALYDDLTGWAQERAVFFTAAGPTYTLILRSSDPTVLRQWALPRLTSDMDGTRGYLIEAHYARLGAAYPSADPTCASDFFLMARDTTGTWWIWIAGDAAALANGSCSRSASMFYVAPSAPPAPLGTAADATSAAEALSQIAGPWTVGEVVQGTYSDLWQGSSNDPTGAGASFRSANDGRVVWRVDLTGPYGFEELYIDVATAQLVDAIEQGR